MHKLIDQLRRPCSGPTSVEYAMLATSVALKIVVAVSFVGTQVNTSYTAISASFQYARRSARAPARPLRLRRRRASARSWLTAAEGRVTLIVAN